ncbi:uncharacterized protein [Clytia hemisphaerica]|uniref:Uncharacterized protein n=1 Tax=Clytia hemisphaerica TaxID=252671 RepID=A0A7M5VHE0_9CNID
MSDFLWMYYSMVYGIFVVCIPLGVFFGFRHPAETGFVTGVYIIFHLFDGVFAFFCRHENDLKSVRLEVLPWQFCSSLIGTIFVKSSIMKSIFGTWAVLSFLHAAIAAIMLCCDKDLRLHFGGSHERGIAWEDKIKQNIRTAPEVVTYCEVREPKPIWKFWKTRKTIWRENKTFKYKHWIDLSQIDEVSINNIENEQNIRKIEFDIHFDDEETEKSYQRHVQNLLDELPEMCRNGEIETERIIKVDGINIEREIVMNLSSNGLEGLLEEHPWLVVLSLPVSILSICQKFIEWLIVRMDIEPFLKKVTIRKVVSNKDVEVI